jgi:LmbE family N-acetylglucosaminyl deacetylase
MRRAIVVAHSDDEVLWAGGLPLRYPGDWTVVCCSTPVKEPERVAQFAAACAALGAKSKIYADEDVSKKTPLKLLDQVDLENFDHIVTHNQWGEYGHPHHKQVHRHVLSKYRHKRLTTFGFRLRGVVSLFGYRLRGKGTHRLDLTPEELARKMAALKKYTCPMKKDGKDIALWESRIDIYCGKKGLDLAVETYDGDWNF